MSAAEKRVEILKSYMANQVKPIFDKLITDLLFAMPANICEWSKRWLEEKGCGLHFEESATTLGKPIEI